MSEPAKRIIPSAPRNAKPDGLRLWMSVVSRYDCEEHELVLLRQAVRLVDLLAELDAVTERDGVMITGSDGNPRANPSVVEGRQHRLALARVLASLRLPEELDAVDGRPQHRGSQRRPYSMGQSA